MGPAGTAAFPFRLPIQRTATSLSPLLPPVPSVIYDLAIPLRGARRASLDVRLGSPHPPQPNNVEAFR
ncbi:hypothetical protein NL676_024038 [Syzygium grande]|nr:hypothetical protein NL676_024038 [Syzygium grande]